jgi:hypothetical protein
MTEGPPTCRNRSVEAILGNSRRRHYGHAALLVASRGAGPSWLVLALETRFGASQGQSLGQ